MHTICQIDEWHKFNLNRLLLSSFVSLIYFAVEPFSFLRLSFSKSQFKRLLLKSLLRHELLLMCVRARDCVCEFVVFCFTYIQISSCLFHAFCIEIHIACQYERYSYRILLIYNIYRARPGKEWLAKDVHEKCEMWIEQKLRINKRFNCAANARDGDRQMEN